MKRTLVKCRSQALHSSSRGKAHARDKKQGDARRKIHFVAVESAEHPGPARTYPGVVGVEAIHNPDTGAWTRCAGPNEWGEHLDRERLSRRRFKSLVKRRGRDEWMSRLDPNPIQLHTVSFHPAHCDLLSDLTARGEGAELPAKIAAMFAKRALGLFEGQRVTLGCALHADTRSLHVDYAVTRNAPGGRIGTAGLGLAGSWVTSVDRQLRSGAKICQANRALFDRAMENFRRREGDVVPFDFRLARLFDEVAARVLGPALTPYIERYAKAVPELEIQHTLAALREAEAVRSKLLNRLSEISPELLRQMLPQPVIIGTVAESARSEAQVYSPTPALAPSAAKWVAHAEPVI